MATVVTPDSAGTHITCGGAVDTAAAADTAAAWPPPCVCVGNGAERGAFVADFTLHDLSSFPFQTHWGLELALPTPASGYSAGVRQYQDKAGLAGAASTWKPPLPPSLRQLAQVDGLVGRRAAHNGLLGVEHNPAHGIEEHRAWVELVGRAGRPACPLAFKLAASKQALIAARLPQQQISRQRSLVHGSRVARQLVHEVAGVRVPDVDHPVAASRRHL